MSDNKGRLSWGEATAEELAVFHVMLWRHTYRDIAPAEALQVLNVERRLPMWERVLADPEERVGVLRDEDGVAGLVHTGPGQGPVMAGFGEIHHLYLRGDLQGQGHGRILLRRGFAELSGQGFDRAALAVVAENHAARAFYARMGGFEDLDFRDAGPLWKSDNLRVVWDLPQ